MQPNIQSLTLLEDPVASELLASPLPLRVAYAALDGTPRLVSVLFHWTGSEVVFSSWPDDPKVAALQANPAVALSIETDRFPFKVLSMRGTATVEVVEGVAPEMLPTFSRYFGPDEGAAWTERNRLMDPRSARIAVRPTWANVLDFETRFPSGMTRRMRAMARPGRA
ncbi:MAG TPA: pyridoxamine 5'-phosphate oxidase family protein [Thermomicrobiales bacterium]|nr:pyridoxamine 5'-phosphate oxidase family protein [Thermomicrobiales bacterium]